jgi:hypothetical protein
MIVHHASPGPIQAPPTQPQDAPPKFLH